jgi:plastocyanin
MQDTCRRQLQFIRWQVNEKYVNSGWLVPKGQEKAFPGSSNTFTVTFQKVGTYDYLCELDPWIVGSVTVK